MPESSSKDSLVSEPRSEAVKLEDNGTSELLAMCGSLDGDKRGRILIGEEAIVTSKLCIDGPAWWAGLDWGSVPNWISSAIAGVGLVGAVVAYRQYRNNLIWRLDDQAAQVRLVKITVDRQSDGDLHFQEFTEVVSREDASKWNRQYRITVQNRSNKPIFDVEIRPNCWPADRDWYREADEILGRSRVDVLFHENRDLKSIIWEVRFVDADGHRWRLTDRTPEPKRILGG